MIKIQTKGNALPIIKELKGKRIKVTDPDHLMDMGRTHAYMKAIVAIEELRKETPTTGLTLAFHCLKALEAENRARVLQENIRLVVREGIDLDAHDVYWQGDDEIIAEPRVPQQGEL
jgi:hypothetical protein